MCCSICLWSWSPSAVRMCIRPRWARYAQVGRYFHLSFFFFFFSLHNAKELMESPCLFQQCQHTHTQLPSVSLFSSSSFSPSLSYEVNIFCRKADGELVLTTSRSASQSLPPSRHPGSVRPVSMRVHCRVATVWHLHGRFIPLCAPSIIQ